MKKAYVKPVFLAEEFECTAAVAGCAYSSRIPAQVYEGMDMCLSKNEQGDGHKIGGSGNNRDKGYVNTKNLWEYATGVSGATDGRNSDQTDFADSAYLFSGRNTECDFIWNNRDSDVGIWTKTEVSGIGEVNSGNWITDPSQRTSGFISLIGKFADVFFGNGADFKKHTPAYKDQQIFS